MTNTDKLDFLHFILSVPDFTKPLFALCRMVGEQTFEKI